MPDARTSDAMTQVRRIWREVSLIERDARLDRGPEPDIGFSEVAFGWAAGRSLASVLEGTDLTAGDFVRWVRQVTDFAGQVGRRGRAGRAARDRPGPGPLDAAGRGHLLAGRPGLTTQPIPPASTPSTVPKWSRASRDPMATSVVTADRSA